MLRNNFNLDLYIAELIEADHYLIEKKKNILLYDLLKYSEKSSILESFIYLDSIKSENTNSSINLFTTNEIKQVVKNLVEELNKFNSNIGLNRNSRYLLEDGMLSAQLPSHYKFDRAVACRLNLNSDSFNKNNLFVPVHTNTIRIYLDFAVLEYEPTIDQIKALLLLGIKKYFLLDSYTDDLFDPIVKKLPKFRGV